MTRRTATALVVAVPFLLVAGSVLSRASLDTGLSPLVGGLAEMVGGLALLVALLALRRPRPRPAPAIGPAVAQPRSRRAPDGDAVTGRAGGCPIGWTVGWTGVLLPGASFFAGLIFLRDTSVGISATAMGVQPLAVFLLLAAFGRALPQRPHPALIVLSAAASTAVGASLLASGQDAIRVGGLIAGGVQVLANAAFLVVDEGAHVDLPEARLARRQLAWALGFGTVVVAIATAAGAIAAREVNAAGIAWSVVAGALSAGLPILLLSRLLRTVPSSLLGAGLGLVPAAALLAGWAIFAESVPGPSLALAALATAVLVAVGARQDPPHTAPAAAPASTNPAPK